jgi:hypothetical protein
MDLKRIKEMLTEEGIDGKLRSIIEQTLIAELKHIHQDKPRFVVQEIKDIIEGTVK